jgi:hypothetical protein
VSTQILFYLDLFITGKKIEGMRPERFKVYFSCFYLTCFYYTISLGLCILGLNIRFWTNIGGALSKTGDFKLDVCY